MLKTASPSSAFTGFFGELPFEKKPWLNIEITNQRPCSPCEPDVYVGAYLVSHLQARCENCNTPETPQWRKGWFSEILGRNVILCNACGLKFNKSQYCPYCYYVYYKEEDKKDVDAWLVCDDCQRWVHVQCEVNAGGQQPDGGIYRCPTCRARPVKPAKHTPHRRELHGRREEATANMMDDDSLELLAPSG